MASTTNMTAGYARKITSTWKRADHDACRRQMEIDLRTLASQGWEEICSVMSDDPNTTEFGMLFTKDGQEFWYNVLTASSMPLT